MRGIFRCILPAACVGLLWVTPATAASAPSLVEEGNRLFREGKLPEALEKYRAAQAADPKAAAALHYNIGNVLYRQGEFDKAYEEYRQAFSARERDLAQGARFNAGNAHFSNHNWPEAIRNYQEALRLNPTDQDAKKNLELALLQMQEEQKKKQQQQDQKNKDQNDDQQQKKKEPQKQDQQNNGNDKRPDQGTPPPDQPPTKANEKERLSSEEAKRILDAMRRQDKPPTDQLKVPKPEKRPEKDW